MSLDGRLRMTEGMNIAGRLTALTGNGRIALDGSWNSRAENYRAEIDTRDFPVNAFMPLLGVGRVTASATASGHGLDIASVATRMSARATSVRPNIQATSTQASQPTPRSHQAPHTWKSTPPTRTCSPHHRRRKSGGDILDWDVTADATRIDLHALDSRHRKTPYQHTARQRFLRNTHGIHKSRRHTRPHADAHSHCRIRHQRHQPRIQRRLYTQAALTNRDFHAALAVECPLDTILASTDSIAAAMTAMSATRRIDAARLQRSIPRMTLTARGARDNFINDMLAPSKMSVDSIRLRFDNDSTLALDGRVLGVHTPRLPSTPSASAPHNSQARYFSMPTPTTVPAHSTNSPT